MIKPVSAYKTSNLLNINNFFTALPKSVDNSCVANENNFLKFDKQKSEINKLFIGKAFQPSFKAYYGDSQPLKKLFWIVSGRDDIYEDNWTKEHLYQVGHKKWLNAFPAELLKRTPEQTIQSLCTLTKPDYDYPRIPFNIFTPYYGNNWGRRANYIEINPRVIAKYDNGRVSEGLLNIMKLITAVPTSANSYPNCIVLSQLYPSLHGDGYTNADSLYCVNLHSGISKALTSDGLKGKMGDDEQVKAFNDMAHLLGFKTGFRMPLSSQQIKVQGRDFDWRKDENAYIDACAWAIDLGFDCIYFDSGKHVFDINGYCGQGAVPDREQMKYILTKIKDKTGRYDLSFVGEKCDDRVEFRDIGYNAGTDWGKADNFESVLWESKKQSGYMSYAAGPEVSNDNDDGSLCFNARLNRLNSCLFGFENVSKKLPCYMQMHDIFPLSPFSNTHELMMHTKQMNGSNAYTECERHYDGVFNTSDYAKKYTQEVYHMFEKAIRILG